MHFICSNAGFFKPRAYQSRKCVILAVAWLVRDLFHCFSTGGGFAIGWTTGKNKPWTNSRHSRHSSSWVVYAFLFCLFLATPLTYTHTHIQCRWSELPPSNLSLDLAVAFGTITTAQVFEIKTFFAIFATNHFYNIRSLWLSYQKIYLHSNRSIFNIDF